MKQEKIKDKIIFHKVVASNKDYFNKSVDALNNIMDILDGKINL